MFGTWPEFTVVKPGHEKMENKSGETDQRWLALLLNLAGWAIILWNFRVLLIVSGGALLGAVLFYLVGTVFRLDYAWEALLVNGIKDGGFYALIWAPGVSFIWCVIEGYQQIRLSRS